MIAAIIFLAAAASFVAGILFSRNHEISGVWPTVIWYSLLGSGTFLAVSKL